MVYILAEFLRQIYCYATFVFMQNIVTIIHLVVTEGIGCRKLWNNGRFAFSISFNKLV